MTEASADNLLTLHAVRLLGFAGTASLAARTGLPESVVEEHLLDAEAYGWTRRDGFAGDTGWSLTEAGRAQDEKLLAQELDSAGARGEVISVHDHFGPLNAAVTAACTRWQLAEPGAASEAAGLADDVASELAAVGEQWRPLEDRLAEHLTRFAGYADRFSAGAVRARTDPRWIAGIEVDSCHRVWFELHEDLLATLGLQR